MFEYQASMRMFELEKFKYRVLRAPQKVIQASEHPSMLGARPIPTLASNVKIKRLFDKLSTVFSVLVTVL